MTELPFTVTAETPDVRFLASLSDGRTVIQGGGTGNAHTWSLLAKFLQENPDIKITCLRLQAPGKDEIVMPSNQAGYYFGRKHIRVFQGGSANYIGIGYYDGNKVMMQWHRTPLFDHCIVEEVDPVVAGFFLIKNT